MKAIALQLRAEDGQVIVFVIAILTILIGMGALVIDGGSWFRAQRHLQTSADAAALAGAQDLPFAVNRAVHCDHVRADELHGAAGTDSHLSVDRAQLRSEHVYRCGSCGPRRRAISRRSSARRSTT